MLEGEEAGRGLKLEARTPLLPNSKSQVRNPKHNKQHTTHHPQIVSGKLMFPH
jgi:hypothetical protein